VGQFSTHIILETAIEIRFMSLDRGTDSSQGKNFSAPLGA